MENLSDQRRTVWVALAIVIIAVIVSSSLAFGLYWSRSTNNPGNGTNGSNPTAQQMTINQAIQAFKNYLISVRNPNLALHEVEEYQYNFYASYYENNTGTFAFQMLTWKPGSTNMMGMMGHTSVTGVPVPEMGPNMMWNTKYSPMSTMMDGYSGMIGYHTQTAGPMTVTVQQARGYAQQYLNSRLPGKMAGDVDTYYGYYTIDILSNGSTFGMLSVNGYTGQVWYHAWHGTYVQTAIS